MNRIFLKSFATLALVAGCSAAMAQAGYDPACWPPMSTTGPSADYGTQYIENDLFVLNVGISGTDTYDKSCVPPNGATFNAPGRIGFSIGRLGSVQSSFDDYLRLQFGMPFMVGGAIGYAMVVDRTAAGAVTKSLIGSNGTTLSFQGASDRYGIYETTVTNYDVRLRFDLVGDAAKFRWRLTNTTAESRNVGMWFGQWMFGLDQNGETLGFAHVYASGNKPFITPQRFQRVIDTTTVTDTVPLQLTDTINFGISQENAYGLQIVNSPTVVNGAATNEQTPVDEVTIGSVGYVLGAYTNNSPTMPDQLVSSDFPVGPFEWGYIQKWQPTAVAANGTREIIAYYKSTWSNANYTRPFSVVVDAPKVISTGATDVNALEPNPFTLRVYVDNTVGYADANEEVTLQDVRVEVSLPPGMVDDTNPTSSTMVATINQINPRRISFVDFRVRVNTDISGIKAYTVQVSSPTGARKLIPGTINVATVPKVSLPSTANLVGLPWSFGTGSWEAILGLKVDEQFQAFKYDPRQAEYVLSTGPTRGIADWLLLDSAKGIVTLGGDPTPPTPITPPLGSNGQPIGGTSLSVALPNGWNLVSNPFPYPIPLGQLSGIVAQDPGSVKKFTELVNGGYISGALFYWDADSATPDYRIISSSTDLLEPNRGYWVYVQAANDTVTNSALTLNFPYVNEPFVGQRVAAVKPAQTLKDWRLNLVARSEVQLDSENFVGVAKDSATATKATAYEPPAAPINGAVSLSILSEVKGKPAKLSTALGDKPGKQAWTVSVYSRSAGPVTVTWPNVNQLPKNLQFRLVDEATKTVRNLRRLGGFTFDAEERSTRTFKLEVEPGAPARPVIGNILATRSGKTANAPLTIAYTLAGDASTTVRILSGGREVYSLSRGRMDKAGENRLVWNLRDNANRSVAPGAYTVEITAESETGERVRKLYPVTVIR
jgi:hypothetical protein